MEYPVLKNIKKHSLIRDAIRFYTWPCLALWVLCGFDSGAGQIEWVIMEWVKALLAGKPFTLSDAVYWWNWAYGKYMHWSALVIYGWMYYFISTRLEQNLGVTGAKNTAYTFGSVFLNISLFETFWMGSFAVFQDQWWIFTLKMPQLRLLMQNCVALGSSGILSLLVLWAYSYDKDDNRLYKFKPDKTLVFITLLTLVSAVFWINYPWHVEKFSVPIIGYGVWTNSNRFPQTVYTIDLDITDNFCMGTMYYVENDTIHAVNTFVKILFALTGFLFIDRWRKT